MAALPELTREAGLDPVLCPHCGRRVQTIDAVDLLFRLVLGRIRKGETVSIRRFGSFRAVKRTGRGIAKDHGDYLVIRFRATRQAKEVLRG